MPPALTSVETAREQFAAAAGRGEGGRAALRRFSDCVDDLLRGLSDEAPDARSSLIVALGGYGRRQLSRHSDIDILILFDGPIGAAEERRVRAVLHPLWDLHFRVGHQIRQMDDFGELEIDNPEFLLALLDARGVAGDSTLLDRLSPLVNTPAAHARLLDALKRLIDERHAKFNDTFYQLEPDVKDAPGGLRDLWASRTIAALTDPRLLDRGPADNARLDEAEEFLLRLRSILHVEYRRDKNVLTHEIQERAAERMGYEGTPRQRVERLMGDYFRHARAVSRSEQSVRHAAPLPVADNLVRSRDGIRFVDLDRARDRPDRWLSVFQAAIDTGTPVTDDTLAWIQRHAERCRPAEFFPTPADRDALLAFLNPQAGLYARLSEMHDCGLLGRMFPEFQRIFCRVVRDFYHKYTVDDHTLLTILNLERLVEPLLPERERFARLLCEL